NYDATRRGFSYFYGQQAALNIHGPVRETKRAKHRRASAQDPARVAICGTANTARTSGGEARRSRRASRDQKGCAATSEGAIAARSRRERLRFSITIAVAASLCEARRP